MSSLLASLDMSLDDIISNKKKNKDSRPAKMQDNRGPPGRDRRSKKPQRRNQPYSRPRGNTDDIDMDVEDDSGPKSHQGVFAKKRKALTIKVQRGRGSGGGKKVSILARVGEKESTSQGTKVLVKNLKFDILEDDVRELFSTVGEVTKAEIIYDRTGRSKGVARVWFAKRSDAEKAIKQYDGRTLDGQAMQISLDENVKKTLFGTALGNKHKEDTKFTVSFGNGGGGNFRGGRGGRGGGGRGGRGGRRNGNNRSMTTATDLDNEMDSYMNDA